MTSRNADRRKSWTRIICLAVAAVMIIGVVLAVVVK